MWERLLDESAGGNLQLPAQEWWVELLPALRSVAQALRTGRRLAHPRAEGEQRDTEHFAEMNRD